MEILTKDSSFSMLFELKNEVLKAEAEPLNVYLVDIFRLYLTEINKLSLFEGEFQIDIEIGAKYIKLDINIHQAWGALKLMKTAFYLPTDRLSTFNKFDEALLRDSFDNAISLYFNSDVREKVLNDSAKYVEEGQLMIEIFKENEKKLAS